MSRLEIWAAHGIGGAICFAFDLCTLNQLGSILTATAVVLLLHRFFGKA